MAIFGKTAVNSNTKQSTIIGIGSYIKGDFTLNSMIYIDGHVEGNINSTDSVVIGKNGIMTGDIKADKVVINGSLVGNVDANSLELLAGADYKGDMEVCELSCEPTGRFVGHCKYKDKNISFENNDQEQ